MHAEDLSSWYSACLRQLVCVEADYFCHQLIVSLFIMSRHSFRLPKQRSRVSRCVSVSSSCSLSAFAWTSILCPLITKNTRPADKIHFLMTKFTSCSISSRPHSLVIVFYIGDVLFEQYVLTFDCSTQLLMLTCNTRISVSWLEFLTSRLRILLLRSILIVWR